MRRLLAILIILAVNIFAIPSNDYAKADYDYMIGVPVVLSNNIVSEYTGDNWIGQNGQRVYQYKANVFSGPIYNDDGTTIDNSFKTTSTNSMVLIGGKKEHTTYSASGYKFAISITGSQVDLSYNDESSSWNPIVYVGDTEYDAIGDPTIDGNTVSWDYGICIRSLVVGMTSVKEAYIFNENPSGDVHIKQNENKTDGWMWDITPYAYDSDGNSIAIDDDKNVLSSDLNDVTYPITIDPTTDFNTSASDEFLENYNTNFNTTWNGSTAAFVYNVSNYLKCGLYWDGSSWVIFRAGLYFDTSSLPDTATISSANLSLYGQALSATSGNTSIVIQTGGGTYPHDPVVATDYNRSYYSGNGGSINTSAWSLSGYNNISLNSTGIGWISLTGKTVLEVRTQADISGVNFQNVPVAWAYEKGAGYIPYLEVTYTTTSAPTVITNSATSITTTSVTLNGNLTATGGATCNVSFQYAVWNGTGWTGNTSTAVQTGFNTSGTTFNESVSSLTANSTYTYEAIAANVYGISYGSWINFITNVPSVVTSAASSVSVDTAQLNGYVSNSYGNNSCLYQFEYGTVSGTYTYSTGWTPGVGTGSYLHALISGLSTSTNYYYISQLDGNGYIVNGSQLSFTSGSMSSFSPPTSLFAVPGYSGDLMISWQQGTSTFGTVLVRNTGAYSTDPSIGTVLYNGSLTSYDDTGLTAGITYYYSAWGVDDTGSYTSSYTTTMVTASVSPSPANVSLTFPNVSSDLFGTLTNSSVNQLPFASLVDKAASDMGMDPIALWSILVISMVLLFGGFTFVLSRSIWMTVIIMLIILIGGWDSGAVQGWVAIMFGIVSTGFLLTVGRSIA